METDSYLTKEEFISKFKFEYALAIKDKEVMSSYRNFVQAIRQIRSDSIKELRLHGVPGKIRGRYNNAIQALAEASHRKYLFYKDPHCGICTQLIAHLEEVTIDHKYPLSKGGANTIENKQIAHGRCNVRKSDNISEKWNNNM